MSYRHPTLQKIVFFVAVSDLISILGVMGKEPLEMTQFDRKARTQKQTCDPPQVSRFSVVQGMIDRCVDGFARKFSVPKAAETPR